MSLISGHAPIGLFGSDEPIAMRGRTFARWFGKVAGAYAVAALGGALLFLAIGWILSASEQPTNWLQWLLVLYASLSVLLTVLTVIVGRLGGP